MNAVLTAYFVVLGTLALTATVVPAIEALFPQRLRSRTALAVKDIRVPFFMKVGSNELLAHHSFDFVSKAAAARRLP